MTGGAGDGMVDVTCGGGNRESFGFGAKSIGVVGGLSMLINNILGPGIANFPGMFQQAGWLPPLLTIAVCALSSLVSGELLVMAMRRMPGNSNFENRVEYSTLCRHYFPQRCATVCIIVFQLAMFSANISNIVQTSQVFDSTIDAIFGDSCAMELYPRPFHFFCGTSTSDITPFGTGKIVLSIGALTVAVGSLPLGYWNLDDNMVVQNIAMLFIIMSLAGWLTVFCILGLDPVRVPAARPAHGIGSLQGLGGTILFNFMFISTLPSWVCEKHPSVTAGFVVTWSLVAASVIFAFVGIFGAMAFPEYWHSDNTILSELHHIEGSPALRFSAQLAVDVYAVAANLSSIPIFSIMMRYNLIEQGTLGPKAAGFVAVVLPWVASVMLYCGTGFDKTVQFAGTFTSSIVNLIVPSLFFIASQRQGSQVDAFPSATEGASISNMQTMASSTFPIQSISSDRSGLLRTTRARNTWLTLARLNTVFMTVFTSIAIVEQLAS